MKKVYLKRSGAQVVLINIVLLLLLPEMKLMSQLIITKTFSFTGSMQPFTVPGCVSSVTADIRGAQGGGTVNAPGGAGGRAQAVMPVTPGELLEVWVGGAGVYTISSPTGGFNGGGPHSSLQEGGTGGGASDVRRGSGLANRIIVAGGGGGGSSTEGENRPGGAGGGLTGGAGGDWVSWPGSGGQGGTQTSGGAAGVACCQTPSPGGFGYGGYGEGDNAAGCGGGGGWYGGGGGLFAAGGGGSSYLDYPGNTYTSTTSGYQTGNGCIILRFNVGPANVVSSPASICIGSSAILSAGGLLTYTWSNGSTSPSISVSPSVTTTYTIVGTNTNNCLVGSAITVTVINSVPAISIASSTNEICLGNTVVVTASGASTYTWTGGIINGVSFAPTASSNYIVTGQNVCGTSTAGIFIAVAPVPVTASSSPTSICIGQSATLVAASSATSYTWLPFQSPVNTKTVVVNPTATTIYTVKVANGSCIGSSTVALYVKSLPIINIVSSASAICDGNSANLAATGGVNYTWTPGNLSGSLITVSPLVSTVYSVTGTSSFGCISGATKTILVNPNPTVNIAATSTFVCAGKPTTLTASGATSYSWSTGSITGSIVVSPSNPTVYIVKGTNTNGCLSTSTISIAVFTVPSVPAYTSVCDGSTITLIATWGGLYSWSTGESTQTITVAPLGNSIYTVTGTSYSNGVQCAVSGTVHVTINPNPKVTVASSRTVVCQGESIVLTGSGAASYTWSTGANSASISVSPTLSPYSSYTVTGSNTYNCANEASIKVKVNICTGISEVESGLAGLSVYPNPGKGVFMLELKNAPGIFAMNVYDATGKVIENRRVDFKSEQSVKFEIKIAGIYIVCLTNDKIQFTKKIIVE